MTRITEREKAEQVYEDRVASNQTAVLATLPRFHESMSQRFLRVKLGNMPPHSKVVLRAYCHQKLEIEDLSYCFRLPMSYVPAYMGNAAQPVKSESSDS